MGIIHNFRKGIYKHIIVSNPKIKAPRKLQDDITKVNISLDVAMMTAS